MKKLTLAVLLAVASTSWAFTPPPHYPPPVITSTSQSATVVAPEQTVTFSVSASSPAGLQLAYVWTASEGSLEFSSSGNYTTSSTNVWTAPSCTLTGVQPTVTVLVRNLSAFGEWTSHTFSVPVTPACKRGWSQAAPAGMESHGLPTRLRSGKILFLGLQTGHTFAPPALYDPATNSWSPAGQMIQPRQASSATLLPSGKVLVVGGIGFDEVKGPFFLDTAELYDPHTNSWSPAGRMPRTYYSNVAALLPCGRVLVAGGDFVNSAAVYDSATNSWSAVGSMATPRSGATATALPSGKVLVAGGFLGGGGLVSAELFDPATNSWSSAGNMNQARYGHTATLLPSGEVLIAGGFSDYFGDNATTSVELYNPTRGTWTRAGSLATPHADHGAALLPSGKVLVMGGFLPYSHWPTGKNFSPTNISAVAEVYDPVAQSSSRVGYITRPTILPSATLLHSCKVLIASGDNVPDDSLMELYSVKRHGDGDGGGRDQEDGPAASRDEEGEGCGRLLAEPSWPEWECSEHRDHNHDGH